VRSPERRVATAGLSKSDSSVLNISDLSSTFEYGRDLISSEISMTTEFSSPLLRSRGPLMDLILAKLKIFLTLRFEEQLAMTGLIEKSICLLCTLIVASQGKNARDVGYLNLVTDIMDSVDLLWKEVLGYLRKIPEYSKKFIEFKKVLTDCKSDIRKKKLLENMPANVKKIMESSVIVRELLSEVRGHLIAVRKLRLGLDEMSEGIYIFVKFIDTLT
jgi:hypothetical protein